MVCKIESVLANIHTHVVLSVCHSVISDSAAALMEAHQALLSMDFPGKEMEWVAIPFSRGSSQPRIDAASPALQAVSLPSDPL